MLNLKYQRTIATSVKKASELFKVVLITGPRQVGKTTLLRSLMEKDRAYVSLDDPFALALAKNDPEAFFQKYKLPILIDEVQRAPELFIHIKRLVDEIDKKGQVWITESQIFSLMQGVSDSLAGRVAVLSLLGFSQAEKQNDCERELFTPEMGVDTQRKILTKEEIFDEIVKGSYPDMVLQSDPYMFFTSYISTYLERDVREITNVQDLTTFANFMKILASRTSQVLNYSDIANNLHITVPTVKRWVSVLETTGLIVLLYPYSRNVSQRSIKSPKLYFTDTGLCSFLLGEDLTGSMLMNMSYSGALFENYVVSEVYKSFYHHGRVPNLYFYRSENNTKEIDLVLEARGKVHPIEIKQSSNPDIKMTKAFELIDEKVRGRGCIICNCSEVHPLSKDVVAIPVSYI